MKFLLFLWVLTFSFSEGYGASKRFYRGLGEKVSHLTRLTHHTHHTSFYAPSKSHKLRFIPREEVVSAHSQKEDVSTQNQKVAFSYLSQWPVSFSNKESVLNLARSASEPHLLSLPFNSVFSAFSWKEFSSSGTKQEKKKPPYVLPEKYGFQVENTHDFFHFLNLDEGESNSEYIATHAFFNVTTTDQFPEVWGFGNTKDYVQSLKCVTPVLDIKYYKERYGDTKIGKKITAFIYGDFQRDPFLGDQSKMLESALTLNPYVDHLFFADRGTATPESMEKFITYLKKYSLPLSKMGLFLEKDPLHFVFKTADALSVSAGMFSSLFYALENGITHYVVGASLASPFNKGSGVRPLPAIETISAMEYLERSTGFNKESLMKLVALEGLTLKQ